MGEEEGERIETFYKRWLNGWEGIDLRIKEFVNFYNFLLFFKGLILSIFGGIVEGL